MLSASGVWYFICCCAVTAMIAGVPSAQGAPQISEHFDGAIFPPSGWAIHNNSNPVGDTTWQKGAQGNLMTAADNSQNFAGVDFLTAGPRSSPSQPATVSNWLIAPSVILHNGDSITFVTSAFADQLTPDRLQVRLNITNTGTDTGTTAMSVGDFAQLLLDINPTYAHDNEPGTYPTTWTSYSLTLSGLPAGPTPGRLAFRYFVEDSGPDGPNGNQIGVDDVVVSPEPNSQLLLGIVAIFLAAQRRRNRRSCIRGGADLLVMSV